MKLKIPVLCILIPSFNESESFDFCLNNLSKILTKLINEKKIAKNSYLYFVDDGSTDDSWKKILKKSKDLSFVKGVRLYKNVGHQNALLYGIKKNIDKCCISISIDADLQQDPNKIPLFVESYINGYDIVMGVRNNRKTDSFFKKNSANLFYWFMKLFKLNLKKNHADYRLLSNKAMNYVLRYPSYNIFLRFVTNDIGLPKKIIYFDVTERSFGSTKYSFSKMFFLAMNSITTYSVFPLRCIFMLGLFFFIFSFFMIIYILISKYILLGSVPGWASILLPIYLLGGLILMSLGVIAEYIGQLYFSQNRQPKFYEEDELV